MGIYGLSCGQDDNMGYMLHMKNLKFIPYFKEHRSEDIVGWTRNCIGKLGHVRFKLKQVYWVSLVDMPKFDDSKYSVIIFKKVIFNHLHPP